VSHFLQRYTLGLLCLLAALPLGSLQAEERRHVTVMTSYPEEMTQRFEAAFTKLHSDVDVQIIWRQSRDAFAELSKPDHGGIDVYWSPALQTFAGFHGTKTFAPLKVDRAVLPGKLGDQPLSDSDGAYEAFEVAGYGLAYNPSFLKELGADVPKSWHAAADAKFAGKITMPRPSHVGFAPALYEVILQGEGWDKGWALLSEVAGNANWDADAHSIDALVDKKTALALTIDFLPLTAAANGKPVAIAYPKKTTFLPAHVALLDGAPHAGEGKLFIDFLLSEKGQSLLLDADVRRYPVRPDVYKTASNMIDPFALPKDDLVAYDNAIAAGRRSLVISLFDVALYEERDRLKTLWGRLHQLEKSSSDNVKTDKAKIDTAKIAEARKLLAFVPVTAEQSLDKAFLAPVAKAKELPAEIREEWHKAVEAHLDQAEALLAKLSQAP